MSGAWRSSLFLTVWGFLLYPVRISGDTSLTHCNWSALQNGKMPQVRGRDNIVTAHPAIVPGRPRLARPDIPENAWHQCFRALAVVLAATSWAC